MHVHHHRRCRQKINLMAMIELIVIIKITVINQANLMVFTIFVYMCYNVLDTMTASSCFLSIAFNIKNATAAVFIHIFTILIS